MKNERSGRQATSIPWGGVISCSTSLLTAMIPSDSSMRRDERGSELTVHEQLARSSSCWASEIRGRS
jgi:hypothetical protein